MSDLNLHSIVFLTDYEAIVLTRGRSKESVSPSATECWHPLFECCSRVVDLRIAEQFIQTFNGFIGRFVSREI